jgi:hypothetical protein
VSSRPSSGEAVETTTDGSYALVPHRLDYAYDVPPVSWMPERGWGPYEVSHALAEERPSEAECADFKVLQFARAQGGRGINPGYFNDFYNGMGGAGMGGCESVCHLSTLRQADPV